MKISVNSKKFHECESCAKAGKCNLPIRNLFGGCSVDYEEKKISWNEFTEVAFDSYVVMLHQCSTIPQIDFIMFRASEDSDISNHDYLRLSRIAKLFMNDIIKHNN